jgi:hypothetical protein
MIKKIMQKPLLFHILFMLTPLTVYKVKRVKSSGCELITKLTLTHRI